MTAAMSRTLPPGPATRFPGQHVLAFSRDRLSFLRGLARDHGDIAQFRAVGPQRVFLLNHPDLIREVLVTQQRSFHKGRALERAKRLLGNGLVTSEGDFHLRQRRRVSPALHRQRLAGYGEVMAQFGERTQARWRDGETLDIGAHMMALTLAVAGKTLFGSDVEDEAADIGAALTDALAMFGWAMLPFTEYLERLPLPFVRKFDRARARLDATIYRIIDERRRTNEDTGDLLSMLLLARDTEADGGHMSDEQIRDEAMTIILAGHETTANALTWAWYLLSHHPEVEARLHAEVDAVLAPDGSAPRLPNADDVVRLPYTRMVVAEAMRLYPPVWALGRRAIEDVEIGGFFMPARSLVIASSFITQRDARWWSDPERFDPERWTPEASEKRPKFSYYPFGGGTRICLGEHFAWMEAVMMLALMSSRWRLRLVPGHRVDVSPGVTLRPKYGMLMTAHRRQR